ncbi:RidA family protein [Cupriavidus sp. CuC1]|uniref:RidA family protein n=1 Tax=Cupriavidus sp. CuC1 TaxID=3373131 RepID=UPI0037CD4650
MSDTVYDKLAQLGITLDPVSAPGALFEMAVQTGKTLFVSGHIARKNGAPWVGKLGQGVGTEEGGSAARAVAIDLLGTLHATLGDLNRVTRVVKVMSLVNSAPDYTEQHIVTNGASALLLEVFGEKGRHARSAFGVAQLPMGACVEIEMVVEVA